MKHFVSAGIVALGCLLLTGLQQSSASAQVIAAATYWTPWSPSSPTSALESINAVSNLGGNQNVGFDASTSRWYGSCAGIKEADSFSGTVKTGVKNTSSSPVTVTLSMTTGATGYSDQEPRAHAQSEINLMFSDLGLTASQSGTTVDSSGFYDNHGTVQAVSIIILAGGTFGMSGSTSGSADALPDA